MPAVMAAAPIEPLPVEVADGFVPNWLYFSPDQKDLDHRSFEESEGEEGHAANYEQEEGQITGKNLGPIFEKMALPDDEEENDE